jgi:DNA-binding IclR family transcriptional regulator
MTVAARILDILYTTDRNLTQADIAAHGNMVPSTVRRTCQELEAAGKIACMGFGRFDTHPEFNLSAATRSAMDATRDTALVPVTPEPTLATA